MDAISTVDRTRWIVTTTINHKWTNTTLINPYDEI